MEIGQASAGSTDGLERWLRDPKRLAVLAAAGVTAATLATWLGEVELRSAGGFGAYEREALVRQFGLWTAWALVTPLAVLLTVRLARAGLGWVRIVALHVVVAAIVACGFLAGEIAVQELAQGPELTQRFAAHLEWQQEVIEARRQAIAEGREPDEEFRRGRRFGGGPPRGEPRGDGPPPREGHPDSNTPPDERQAAWRAGLRRSRSRGLAANVATGDFRADFARRWMLRVPRYALVYFTLLGIGLGIRAYLAARTREREAQRLETQAARLQRDLTAAKLEALKGQLHPHFLFNALHSVGGLVRTGRTAEALTALDSIGDLLRTSLDADPEQFVSLDREVELVRRYLAVESLRLGDRLHVTIDVPHELGDVEVPAFLAQPLVENAIKHGIASRPDGGSVHVRAFADGETTLVIDVENDGPAFTPNGRGVGLSHVRGRLEALFDEGAALEITDRPAGGVRARLRLPLEDIDPTL